MAKDLFDKIRALSAVNEEIIENVESRTHKFTYRYRVKHDSDHQVHIDATEDKESVQDMLTRWKAPISLDMDLLAITRELHDYLNVEEVDWISLKALNRAFLCGLDRLEPFLLTSQDPLAETELRKYLHNYEAIQVALGKVDEMTTSQMNQTELFAAKAKSINDAYNELLCAIPPLGPFEDSSILSFTHAKTLANWYFPGNDTHAVKLLYRGSRDGMNSKSFHNLCDDQGPTVTVVQSDQGYVFGGYAGVSFTCTGGYLHCDNSSLFTLLNYRQAPPTRLKHREGRPAIYCHKSFGPTFGDGHDLGCRFRSDDGDERLVGSSRLGNSFYDPSPGYLLGVHFLAGEEVFRISEVEVFRIAPIS